MTPQNEMPTVETDKTRDEHSELRNSLRELDEALEHMRCTSGCVCDLSGASEVQSMIQHFKKLLPAHFRHEEKGLHKKVAVVSPELEELTYQLKMEHVFLANLFAVFAESADTLKWSADVPDKIARTKLLGGAFTNQLLQHMATEEIELAGFL
jgi:hemerythrin-like domain-containing protein